VVISGVGSKYAVELPLAFSSRPSGAPAILIDVDDAFDDRAVQDTTQRLEEYGLRRWPVFPERRISFLPKAVPTRSRTERTAYRRRTERMCSFRATLGMNPVTRHARLIRALFSRSLSAVGSKNELFFTA
jgi:hypothetical protein